MIMAMGWGGCICILGKSLITNNIILFSCIRKCKSIYTYNNWVRKLYIRILTIVESGDKMCK